MKASWYGHSEIVKLLLQFGANTGMHLKSKYGDTALSKAKEWRREEIVKLLEEKILKTQKTSQTIEEKHIHRHNEL